jgi:GxxExxY protein
LERTEKEKQMMPIERCDEVDPVLDQIAAEVVDSAYQVHSTLGPGLLENSYEACLVHTLAKRGRKVERQVPMPLEYDGVRLDVGYRIDLLVDGELIVEIKAVESLLPIHTAQILTYLKLMNKPLGLLINFNETYFKRSVKRIVLSKKESR